MKIGTSTPSDPYYSSLVWILELDTSILAKRYGSEGVAICRDSYLSRYKISGTQSSCEPMVNLQSNNSSNRECG
jgi:hypothetical protein